MGADFEMTMNEFLPLRDVVFNTLRKAILTGELKPGERLMEIHLANRLGVSRTPIREAIRKLELEGLVIMIPRRGAEVAQITEKSLKDVLEEEKRKLKQACDQFRHAAVTGDAATIAAADVAFHDIIVLATGNERLIQLINNLSEQMYRYRFEYIKDESRHDNLVQEHRMIYDSIIRGEKKKAAEAARLHIDNQEKSVIRQIRLEQENSGRKK